VRRQDSGVIDDNATRVTRDPSSSTRVSAESVYTFTEHSPTTTKSRPRVGGGVGDRARDSRQRRSPASVRTALVGRVVAPAAAAATALALVHMLAEMYGEARGGCGERATASRAAPQLQQQQQQQQ